MEGELNNLIETCNVIDKKFEIREEEEDDFQSSLDIKEFERKLKTMPKDQEPKIVKGFVYNDNEPDSSEDEKNNVELRNKMKENVQIQKKPTTGSVKKIEEENKLDQITREIVSNKGGNNALKKEDMEIEKALNTKNESFKDRKIKELTQKNKALNVAFEREKSLRMKCEKELSSILKETESNLEKLEGKVPAKKKEEGSIEDWKSKYAAADKKIQELRFEKQTLKNELNKAIRVIGREIGENFNIDEVLLQENSWKGRAQQIQILQNKIKELQGKIATSREVTSSGNSVYSEQRNEMNGSNYSQLSAMSKGAEERRKEIEALKNQTLQMKNENELLQSKIKAVNSRKSILENEIKEIKAQYDENKKLLVEKSANDDKYIMALKTELEKLKSQHSAMAASLKSKETQLQEKPKENTMKLPPDYEKLRQEYLLLKDQLDQKEKIIKELINEKVKDSSFRVSEDPSVNAIRRADEARIRELESEIFILKKENEELVKTISANYDKDSEFTIKNLCGQNAQLRKKNYDLQQKLDVGNSNAVLKNRKL